MDQRAKTAGMGQQCELLLTPGGVSDDVEHGGSGSGVQGTIRRRVCKSCGRFADEHGKRRRAGACSCFIYSHSIILTWRAAFALYRTADASNPPAENDGRSLTVEERSLIDAQG